MSWLQPNSSATPLAIEPIERATSIVLVSHVQPDGDALGSLFGMYHALHGLGKKVRIIMPAPIPPVFTFLSPDTVATTDQFPSDDSIDLCVVLDVGDSSRTGYPTEIKRLGKARKLMLVDHHPKGDLCKLEPYMLHRTTASSTAELCYELINRLGIKITPSVATPLLLGLYTDTGAFQYTNTTTDVLGIASELMKRGARLRSIVDNLNLNKSLASLRLLGLALTRLTIHNAPVPFAVSTLTHDDLLKEQATLEETHGIIGELNTLPTAEFTLFLRETDKGLIQGSLRSEPGSRLEIGSLAKILGGGGHARAAGFQVTGTLIEIDGHWQIV